jgi:hypothetical protein
LRKGKKRERSNHPLPLGPTNIWVKFPEDSHVCFGENYHQLQFRRIKGLFRKKKSMVNEDSLHMVANVCSWADPNRSHVLLPKVYRHRRRKRSKLVTFLGDLGQKLLICRDPSSSGKIRWEKSRTYLQPGQVFLPSAPYP